MTFLHALVIVEITMLLIPTMAFFFILLQWKWLYQIAE